jgi:hypothetical protein
VTGACPWRISKAPAGRSAEAVDVDFMEGQSRKILSGGGCYAAHRTFVDEMWAANRNSAPNTVPPRFPKV